MRQQRRHVVHAGVLAVHRAERVVDVRARANAASWPANAPRSASSLLVSPGLNRRFSSSATSPSASPADRRARRTRRRCRSRSATGAPSSSPSRSATGASEYFGSGAPLGRPRCDITMTRAPASRSALSVGSTARIRPSSVMRRVAVERDVQVGAHQHPPTPTPSREQIVERLHSRAQPTSLTRSTRRFE